MIYSFSQHKVSRGLPVCAVIQEKFAADGLSSKNK